MDSGRLFNGPVVLVIMDGIGLSPNTIGNAVRQARTDFLNYAATNYLNLTLEAAGEAVGLPAGIMGNSEVGHNTIGSGQIIQQGIAHINNAFISGQIWQSSAWLNAIKNTLTSRSTLHFAGIFSDGGVHSDIHHLEQMIAKAYEQGVTRIRVHAIFDGRDVPPQSEPKYIKRLETFFQQFPNADFKIASGGGRMVVVADRYENDWQMVKKGWDMMVHGEAEHQFFSAEAAIQLLRAAEPSVQDQYLPPFVIVDQTGTPVGTIEENDTVIYYDFRADRAVEIASAFTRHHFPYFDRSSPHHALSRGNSRPNVYFAGLTEYDADTRTPEHCLVEPVKFYNTLHTFLGEREISQLAISETAKFGHITYYFNGNSYIKAKHEEAIEIPSDTAPFNTRPWMKSAEITDTVLDKLHQFQFVRINFPNGDMVGHFGELIPTIISVEAVDIQLARIARKVDELGGMMIITADHGNAEEILDSEGNPKTSHTTNPVPCIFYDNTENRHRYQSARLQDAGLSNLAATIALLLGQKPLSAWRPPLIVLQWAPWLQKLLSQSLVGAPGACPLLKLLKNPCYQ